MQKKLFDSYDEKQGAWGSGQKYLNWDNVEYCLDLSSQPEYYRMARQTLTAQLQLLDPVWGGVYQYSTNDDWVHPHFEKIMQMQSELCASTRWPITGLRMLKIFTQPCKSGNF